MSAYGKHHIYRSDFSDIELPMNSGTFEKLNYTKLIKYYFSLIFQLIIFGKKILLNDFKHFKPKNKSKSYLYERDSLKNKKVELNWDFDKTYNFCRGNEFPPFEPAYFEKDGKKIYLITNLKNFKK